MIGVLLSLFIILQTSCNFHSLRHCKLEIDICGDGILGNQFVLPGFAAFDAGCGFAPADTGQGFVADRLSIVGDRSRQPLISTRYLLTVALKMD
jgi:hypothetical protein